MGFDGIELDTGAQEGRCIGQERGMLHFSGEIPLEVICRDGVALGVHVATEGMNNLWNVQHACAVGVPEIEEITPLAALVKGAQFGSKKLGRGIDRKVGGTCEPAGLDGEVGPLQRHEAQMLARVDLDFQPKSNDGRQFGFKPVSKGGPTRADVAPWLPQPRIQALPEVIQSLADGFLPDLYEIQILRIAGRRLKHDLVQRRAAPEEQPVT